MFTGVVEQMGEVVEVSPLEAGRRLVIAGKDLGHLRIGASISINGACLTAVETEADTLAVDVIPETLGRTTLGRLEIGDRVNLERPMAANGRFDGHIVQGHVDGIGVVGSIVEGHDGTVMKIDVDSALAGYLVEKGSITVDGVSLTVSGLSDAGFSVALIPHTLDVTTLGSLQVGDTVNLEMDVIAKYVERLLNIRK